MSDITITFIIFFVVVALFIWNKIPAVFVALGSALAFYFISILDFGWLGAMEQGTGVRAGRGSEFTSKLLIFSSRPVRLVLVQSWPGASVVGSWEVSER